MPKSIAIIYDNEQVKEIITKNNRGDEERKVMKNKQRKEKKKIFFLYNQAKSLIQSR